ncbi:hypothetical protein RN001_005039 [Aquatica leii]|uniref:Uncharacterized protein n=1 Tax=Aquatica leii TaxID=1421715 RepID=A0AAN7Q6B4_9COLE|nr:hypothetical protein RN001_005039 [Aquatica leii]
MIGTDDGRSSNSQKVTQLSIREFKKALHDVEPMTTWESSSVRHIDSSKKITSEKSKNLNDVIKKNLGIPKRIRICYQKLEYSYRMLVTEMVVVVNELGLQQIDLLEKILTKLARDATNSSNHLSVQQLICCSTSLDHSQQDLLVTDTDESDCFSSDVDIEQEIEPNVFSAEEMLYFNDSSYSGSDIEPENIQKHVSVSGRRIVDLKYFLGALKSLQHVGFGCPFFDVHRREK